MSSTEFSASYRIEKPESGTRWVIPDIHGCYDTLLALLDQISINRKDQLFLLGDLVDRGLNSAKVLDHIMQLMLEGYQVYCLRGNHEQMILDAQAGDKFTRRIIYGQFNSADLLNEKGELIKKYKEFMTNLPYYFELDHFLLVHAGFDFDSPSPFENYHEMIWIRYFQVDSDLTKNKIVIHGHTPKVIEEIQNAVTNRANIIPLDNGCVHMAIYKGMGKLLAFNLDSFELIEQDNIEQ